MEGSYLKSKDFVQCHFRRDWDRNGCLDTMKCSFVCCRGLKLYYWYIIRLRGWNYLAHCRDAKWLQENEKQQGSNSGNGKNCVRVYHGAVASLNHDLQTWEHLHVWRVIIIKHILVVINASPCTVEQSQALTLACKHRRPPAWMTCRFQLTNRSLPAIQ